MKRSGVVGFVAGSEVGDLSVSFASAVMGSWADSCSEELETFSVWSEMCKVEGEGGGE